MGTICQGSSLETYHTRRVIMFLVNKLRKCHWP